MAVAFRAKHISVTSMTHVRKDDQSRLDHIICSTEDYKLIKGIAMDSNSKFQEQPTSHSFWTWTII